MEQRDRKYIGGFFMAVLFMGILCIFANASGTSQTRDDISNLSNSMNATQSQISALSNEIGSHR